MEDKRNFSEGNRSKNLITGFFKMRKRYFTVSATLYTLTSSSRDHVLSDKVL